MEKTLVSIIVPVYNVEKYLEHCINSLINQTYEKIEILLINDGSKDNSGKICDEYKKKDKRIKVFHKENEGLGLTRNFGIERAKGKYIVFVDSDDYLSTTAIETLMNYSKKYDTVIGGYTKVTNEGKELFVEKYQKEEFTNENVLNKLLPRLLGSLPNIKDSIFTTVCARLYSAKIINDHNIRFKSEREMQSEDLGFQFDYFRYSKHACVIDANIYYYRYNPSSLTTIYKKNRFEETLKVYEYINKMIKLLELPESAYLRNKKMLFVQIWATLSQENKKTSKKSKKDRTNTIKRIINNELLQDAVNNYPINKLTFKQKIFVTIIKNKNYRLMQLLIDAGLC